MIPLLLLQKQPQFSLLSSPKWLGPYEAFSEVVFRNIRGMEGNVLETVELNQASTLDEFQFHHSCT